MNFEALNSEMLDILKRQILISIILVSVTIIALIIGILCFKLLYKTSKIKAVCLLMLTVICFVTLFVLRSRIIVKSYNDYKNQSYIVLQNVECYIKYGNIGVLESVHTLSIDHNGKKMELKIEEKEGSFLETGKYIGDLAFSKETLYVLKYDLIKLEGG